MFISLTNHQTDKPVNLTYGIDNVVDNINVVGNANVDGKTIAVHEISYTIKWLNVTGLDYYMDVKTSSGTERTVLAEGYYNFCDLKESLFDPIDVDVNLNNANLKIKINFSKNKDILELSFSKKLADILGSEMKREGVKKVYVGVNPVNLGVHKFLYIHLHELNSAENLHNGTPSTLLRVVPAGTLGFCDTEVIRFPSLQFKKLQPGYINALNLSVYGDNNKLVKIDDLSIILEVR